MTLKKSFAGLMALAALMGIQAFAGIPAVWALNISGAAHPFSENEGVKTLNTIRVEMDTETPPLKAGYGLTLILDEDQRILWHDATSIAVSGPAADAGKIAAAPPVMYSADHKQMYIPLLTDWQVGDVAFLDDLRVRVYDRMTGYREISADTDNDSHADYVTSVSMRIGDTRVLRDRLAPFPAQNFKAAVLQDPLRVRLTWEAPVEYDFSTFDLQRDNAFVADDAPVILIENGTERAYEDTNVKQGDRLTYHLFTNDRLNNRGEAVLFTITAEAPAPASTGAPSTAPADAPAAAATETPVTTEAASLQRLFNYYRARYQIKCLAGGQTAQPGDSACLWAKIDYSYAQDVLGRSDGKISLSARELALMGLRLPFSEKRYQTACKEAASPAPYCTALAASLARARHFLTPSE